MAEKPFELPPTKKKNKRTNNLTRLSDNVNPSNPYHQVTIYSPKLRLDQFAYTNTLNPFIPAKFDSESRNEKFSERDMFRLRRNISYLLHVEERIFNLKSWQIDRFKARVSESFAEYIEENIGPEFKYNGLYGYIFYNECLLLIPVLYGNKVHFIYVRNTRHTLMKKMFAIVPREDPWKILRFDHSIEELIKNINDFPFMLNNVRLSLIKPISRPIPPWSIQPVKDPNIVTEDDLLLKKVQHEKQENDLIAEQLLHINNSKVSYSYEYTKYLELPSNEEVGNDMTMDATEKQEYYDKKEVVVKNITESRKQLLESIVGMVGSNIRAESMVAEIERKAEEKVRIDKERENGSSGSSESGGCSSGSGDEGDEDDED